MCFFPQCATWQSHPVTFCYVLDKLLEKLRWVWTLTSYSVSNKSAKRFIFSLQQQCLALLSAGIDSNLTKINVLKFKFIGLRDWEDWVRTQTSEIFFSPLSFSKTFFLCWGMDIFGVRKENSWDKNLSPGVSHNFYQKLLSLSLNLTQKLWQMLEKVGFELRSNFIHSFSKWQP